MLQGTGHDHADTESFEIRTSTMILGIRGTSGVVKADADGCDSVIITDGSVTVKGINPDNGEEILAKATAGDELIVKIHPERETGSVEFEIKKIKGGDLPSFAKEVIGSDPSLLDRVLDACGWNDRLYI